MAPDRLDEFGEDLERRGNGAERDRIAQLAKHFARIARRLDSRERALERAVKALIVAIVIAFGFGSYLAISVRQQADATDKLADSIAGKVSRADVTAATAKVEAATAKKLAATQTEGRKVAVAVTCGALRGVQDAGRMVLTQRLPGTERFVQPSTSREQRIRRQFARAYNRVITDRIVEEAGARGARVIEPNGSVNCDLLRTAAGTAEPPP